MKVEKTMLKKSLLINVFGIKHQDTLTESCKFSLDTE